MRNVEKILFITLSNMGDVVLSLPVFDYLRENFPKARITVMVGPRPKEIFENNPNVDTLIVFDKHSKLTEKIRLFFKLKKEKFDIVIDLRNSMYGVLLGAPYKTSPSLFLSHRLQHMKSRYLYILKKSLKIRGVLAEAKQKSFYIDQENKDYIERLLKERGITPGDRVIIVNAASASDAKRWEADKFIQLCRQLSGSFKVILTGTKSERAVTGYIHANCDAKIYDFAGLTNLAQLAYLLKRADLLITCDTGTLQLASYFNKPIIALFGPTDQKRYGPWSERFRVVKKQVFCLPCKAAQCRFGNIECMKLIKVEDVLRQVNLMLGQNPGPGGPCALGEYRRILISRTDRIGDVLLSTPVIKALREACPTAYIAMLVSPYAKEIVEGNPYLDEVIIYDKDTKHRSWSRSIIFAGNLKKKEFDLAIVLHPANRVHLVTFLAGIPRRVGYDRKMGFLLTDRVKHTKQSGEKHELEYNLELLRYLGIEAQDKSTFMPIKEASEKWAQELLARENIRPQDKIMAIHPGASCVSKIWPAERFAQIADKSVDKYGFKVLVVAGPKDLKTAGRVCGAMRHKAVNLAGKTSVSQLASVLKRCSLFVSNDSGPVHIASSLGVPVISIFGRGQKGLSPKRWGPLGKKDRVLHKEAGCIECLAHNCVKEFACLKAITVEDVLRVIDEILSG